MRNFKRTYDDLSDLIRQLEKSSLQSPLLMALKSAQHPHHQAIRTLVGCQFLAIDPQEALLEFRAHRFFCDAIGIIKLPEPGAIQAALAEFGAEAVKGLAPGARLAQNIAQLIHSVAAPEQDSGYERNSLSPDESQFLQQQGYLVIPDVIPHALCDELAAKVNALLALEGFTEGAGFTYGSGKMRRIYHLLARDALFRQIVLHPVVHAAMGEMFHRPTFHSKYYLTSFHANLLLPGAEAQVWHIDANVPEPLPPWIIRANSNFIIEDYSADNGATQIVRGSHLFARKPNASEAQSHDYEVVNLSAPKGSIIVWHGHLWHRSGHNRSARPRIALLGGYAASFFREVSMEENPYLSMSPNIVASLPAQLKSIIGWHHGAKNY